MRILILSVIAMTFSLSGCSSQKKFVKTPPFEVGQATCQTWTGGRPESGSGIKLEIPISNLPKEGDALQQAYFRGKMADIKLKDGENGKIATANFMNNRLGKPDIIMHSDPKQEVGNQPPKPEVEFPFELSPNECVVSYLDGDTVKYVKIEDVKELKPLIYK